MIINENQDNAINMTDIMPLALNSSNIKIVYLYVLQ